MMLSPPTPEMLRSISSGAIHDFLTRRGWVEKSSSRPNFRYYEHSNMRFDDGGLMYYYFLSSQNSRDYPLSVLDFIKGQARFWDLTPEAVFNELTGVALAEPVRTSIPTGEKPCQNNGMRPFGDETSMLFSPPKPETFQTIPVSAVHDFLTRRGWVQKPSTLPEFRYYEHSVMFDDDGRRLFFYFPASDHFIDYPLRVLDFIEGQSQFWDVTPEAVFNELTGVALA